MSSSVFDKLIRDSDAWMAPLNQEIATREALLAILTVGRARTREARERGIDAAFGKGSSYDDFVFTIGDERAVFSLLRDELTLSMNHGRHEVLQLPEHSSEVVLWATRLFDERVIPMLYRGRR
jgi:hypothetical protein